MLVDHRDARGERVARPGWTIGRAREPHVARVRLIKPEHQIAQRRICRRRFRREGSEFRPARSRSDTSSAREPGQTAWPGRAERGTAPPARCPKDALSRRSSALRFSTRRLLTFEHRDLAGQDRFLGFGELGVHFRRRLADDHVRGVGAHRQAERLIAGPLCSPSMKWSMA